MSHFTVDQLVDLSFSNKSLYVLPETIKKLLIDLEACLEITDTTATEHTPREYKYADSRRSSDEFAMTRHRNRYDLDVSSEKGKKRDFRQSKVPNSDWRSGSSVSTSTSSASLKDDVGADNDWEMMRTFKATKIGTKTGIEKIVNDIRIALNKMSATNYDKQRDALIGLVNGYFEESSEEVTEENTKRISRAIFDIASTNKFYSEIYARLYKELVEAHSIFGELLEVFVHGFTCMDSVPVYVDPDTDYDGFCVYSKACEVRKSTSTFLVNCLKQKLIDPDRISDILIEFVKYVDVKRSEEGMVKLVEEIVENVYIIATLCGTELSKTVKWREYLLPTIKRIIAEKIGTLPSMSNRANFKLMDLLDKI